jgi:pyruvate/2-oxoglutarate dehydrogenase complex dihydrolipoamide dehydrogenase (E3) component
MHAAAKTFQRPRRFDFNLAVIGAGSAGLVSAYIAAASKAKVALIERERMGGDCLNTGCVPSKALIRSARIASYIRRADEYGLRAESLTIDFPAIMQRVRDVIAKIEPHDSVERYSKLGVDCMAGHARITSPWSLDVAGKSLTARNLIIASGGRPSVPPIPGLQDIDYLTSDTIWSLRAKPARFLVLGGGPIGCELAQAFSRLGSTTTIVEMLPRLLVKEDPEVSTAIEERFAAENIRVLTGYTAARFETRGDRSVATCERNGDAVEIEFDALLVAVGRRANTDGFGLAEAGVELSADGTVTVNEYLQTSRSNIYACGDAAGPYQLTHAAAHQAWYCAMNALFGRFKKFKVDYSVIPWAVFTDPEVARVGLSEQEALEQGLNFDITRYGIDDLDRAIADGEAHGFVKLLTARGSERILGATIVGHHAGDLIAEYVSAMRNGLGVRKILNTIHIYPTLVEANRYAAGEWQKARLSPRLLRIAERYHRWVRG